MNWEEFFERKRAELIRAGHKEVSVLPDVTKGVIPVLFYGKGMAVARLMAIDRLRRYFKEKGRIRVVNA